MKTIWSVSLGVSLFAAVMPNGMMAAQASMSPELLATLREGSLPKLRAALDAGASPNAVDADGSTPLMHAAVYGDLATMMLLLDRGAEVNAANRAGATPLIRAAFDFDKARLLVEHGANVNARSAMGNTPLMLAARPANSHRTVELLLKHGAEVNATNNWGATALMAAAASEDTASVRLLIRHGAVVNAQSQADPVGFIYGGARSPLMWSSFRGDLATMKTLLAAGAEVDGEGFFGTPLMQTAWSDQTKAAQLLLKHGAKADYLGHGIDYTALHWAASTESSDDRLVKLLLSAGANPNVDGGSHIEAFVGVSQTPLMLAQRRGETKVLAALQKAGATNGTEDLDIEKNPPARQLPAKLDPAMLRAAISQAIKPLQETALISKQNFVKHELQQDCTSCHQQYFPMAAVGFAKRIGVQVDAAADQQLVDIVHQGELKNPEGDWQTLFHPDPANTKGYTLFGWAADHQPADAFTDAAVHHIAMVQGRDGRWFNNIPRPPMQTSDVGPTALGIHALQKYPLPGRRKELAGRVQRARQWLHTVQPANTDERVYQILGRAWGGETPKQLQSLARALLAEQRPDGGWAQLPTLESDAFATGQAIYALRVGAGLASNDPAMEKARRYLLQTQLEDGTWFVHRRAFPFQPSMKSGFPHGRDGWISATATSWAVMALSLSDDLGKPSALAKNN